MTNPEFSKNIPSKKAIDPVCGMTVEPGNTKLVSVYQGRSYWFCAQACREAFDSHPNKYLECKPLKRKNWFRRYLERMARINKKEFGSGGAKCH